MEKAVKKANAPRSGGGRLSYFGLEDGESIVVRFLTDVDEIITCDSYEFVHDNQGGKKSFLCAPSLYEDDPSWQGEDWVVKYGGMAKEWGNTELTPAKRKERTMAIAVEREEIPIENPGGRPKFRYQDKLIKHEDKDGNVYDARNFIIIQQPAKTFWTQPVGFYGEFGTLCDRDYKITRQGKQLNTAYIFTPKAEDDEWLTDGSSLKALQARYGYGTGKDMDGNDLAEDSPDRFLYCTQTLWEWAERQASQERAEALLGSPREGAQQRRQTPSSNGSEGPPWATGEDEAQAAPPSASGELSALRARLDKHK